jgi:hypothetical protein
MSRWWAVLLCMFLVGCGGATQKVRRAAGQQERCVYVPRHRYYSGRTSMVVDLTKSLEFQAWLAVAVRDMNHHIDEDNEPRDVVFAPPEVDVFDVGAAIDYGARYEDVAYWRVRGREQQLMDSHGGAQSDTGKPYRTENVVRGVAKDNPWGRRFHDAATERWGQRYPYTGH